MRVLIADDHPLLVEGLCSLLGVYGIDVVSAVGDGQAVKPKRSAWNRTWS